MLLKSGLEKQVLNNNPYSRLDIRLNNTSVKVSPSQLILNNIGLEIKEGEIIAILGQSGAGKSTLLRTMAGLIKPSQNSVMFNDIDFFSLKKNKNFYLEEK